MDLHERLRAARQAAGFKSAMAAAERLGIPYGTYSGHENGGRGVRPQDIARYARAFKVSPSWLLTGMGEPNDPTPQVPLVGYVGAGDLEHRYGEGHGEVDTVPAPRGASERTVAVEVRGDSLGPFFDRALIFYDERFEPFDDSLLGLVCVVGLRDGQVLVKQVRRGSAPGRYTLFGQFGAPIEDVEIAWAAPVIDIKPRGAVTRAA